MAGVYLVLLLVAAVIVLEWRRALAEKKREHFVQLRAHWLRNVYNAQVGCDLGDYYVAWTEKGFKKIHFFNDGDDFEKFRNLYGVPQQLEFKLWSANIPGIEEIWE